MSLWQWWRRRRQEDDDLEAELRFHLEQEAQLRVDRGEALDIAARSARRDFGNFTLAQEVTRDMWGITAIERAAQDVRYAARVLRKNKAFTAVALGALALGIGATTAIFSVVDSVLLKPLPFPDPGRLVMVWERSPGGRPDNSVQTQNFLDWRQRNHSFEAISAIMNFPANLVAEGNAVQVPSLRVSANFFSILGVPPMLGRAFRPGDDAYHAPCVAVLGHGFWQRQFGSRASLIGKTINLGVPCVVVGVMPPGFGFPTMRADVYIPFQINPADAPQDGRYLRTVARLRPGVALQSAQAEMRSIAAATAQERPRMNTNWSANVVPLLEQTVGDTRTILLVLLGAVGFVLLIACVNVANLLLMRAASRRREIAVRVALGAGRWRLLHQLTIESLLLAVTGGLLGFLLAYWGVPTILRILPAEFPLPRLEEIAVDRTVLAFTMLISVGCGLFFGVFPALHANRAPVSRWPQYRGLRSLLVIAEVAVAVLLVIGAGLMLRSFVLLNEVNPGFRAERLITFRMILATPLDARWQEHRAARLEQMLDGIRALPMVAAASSINTLPLAGNQSGSGYSRGDRPAPPPGSGTGGTVSVISDGYFHTMGIPLIAGREFDPHDRKGAPHVAILNESAARKLYPGEDAVGKRLRIDWFPVTDAEIIGVAADVLVEGLDRGPEPCLFLAHAQAPNGWASLVVRTTSDPAAAIAAVKEQIRTVAPNQGVQDVTTMDQLISSTLARPKLQVVLMGIFGAVALLLACVGVFAVISYSVQQRTRELGIRVALGAAPLSILRLVLQEGLSLAGAGIVIGLLSALALTRYLSTLLYTIKPTDPPVYAAVTILLSLAALAGCYAPARRAIRVDPAVVLRAE